MSQVEAEGPAGCGEGIGSTWQGVPRTGRYQWRVGAPFFMAKKING